MNVVKLNNGDKYRFIVHNPNSERYGEWIDCDVLSDIVYGYEIDRKSYVIHNEKGPAITWTKFNNSKTYALHGRIYEYDEWIKKLRKYKIKKVCLE